MKLYRISVPVIGEEFYEVEAESEAEAVKRTLEGDAYFEERDVAFNGDPTVLAVDDEPWRD